jgi:hypothetical protein
MGFQVKLSRLGGSYKAGRRNSEILIFRNQRFHKAITLI